MAAIYPKAKEQFMKSLLNLTSATVNAVLLKNTYTYSATHTSVSASIGATFQASSAIALTGTSVSTDGVFDATDPTFVAVASGSTVNAVLIYSGDIPIAYLDSGVGVPFATSGADVTITFSNGADKVFRL
jgi:hypothetical protein